MAAQAVSFLSKITLNFKKISVDNFTTELNSEFSIELVDSGFIIVAAYRPCNSLSNSRIDIFLTNLENLLLNYRQTG